MTHIWDVPEVVQAGVHLLHKCQLNLVLLTEAVHNECELNKFTASIDVAVLPGDLQHIAVDVTVGGGGCGGARWIGRGRWRMERWRGRKEGGGAKENRNFSIVPITFQHAESLET